MGEHTPVLQDDETVDVTLDFTVRANGQLERMPEPVRELARSALLSFAARIGNYFSQEVDNISYIGRTKEDVFTIGFEVFGPYKALIHDIMMDFAPIDESKGFFRISHDGNTIILQVPSSDSISSQIFEIVYDNDKVIDRRDCYSKDILNSKKCEDIQSILGNLSNKYYKFRNKTAMDFELSDCFTERLASRFSLSTAHGNDYLMDLSYLTPRKGRCVATEDGAATLLLLQISQQCADVVRSARCTD